MKNVHIEIPELGALATKAQILDNHTDVLSMLMHISVGLFNESDDLLKMMTFDHQLTEFPIPSLEEQWEIILPLIEQLQQSGQ